MRLTSTLAPIPKLALILALALGLSGCAKIGQSRLNPLNWFRSGQPTMPVTLYVPKDDQRILVAKVLALKIDRNLNGAIIRATGLPPTQGWWKADLVKVDQEDATKIVYEFRLYPPVTPEAAGAEASRRITVARSLSNVQLEGIDTIVVQGATNALSARR